MKKIILSLAFAIGSIAAFAGEENVNAVVLKSFQQEFAGAENVSWTTGKNSYKASFVLNSQYVVAYYNFNGDLMGLTRNISSLDLPLGLQTELKKNYKGYWISDLFEVSNQEGTNYYITLEKADETLILEAGSYGKWSVYKRASKA
jgi:hypothetical protein